MPDEQTARRRTKRLLGQGPPLRHFPSGLDTTFTRKPSSKSAPKKGFQYSALGSKSVATITNCILTSHCPVVHCGRDNKILLFGQTRPYTARYPKLVWLASRRALLTEKRLLVDLQPSTMPLWDKQSVISRDFRTHFGFIVESIYFEESATSRQRFAFLDKRSIESALL